MAAIVRRAPFKTAARWFATKAEKAKGLDRKVAPRVEWTAQSLASKGFLRPQRDYEPPTDAKAKLDSILASKLTSFESETPLGDLQVKFDILNKCSIAFQHSVPNSLLCSIETVGDLREFYITPVVTKTPLDKLKDIDLPPNLHVQHEYHRYNPDVDGKTAFPRSSTLVTGLKYKDKYKGHRQPQGWPYE